MKLKIEGLEEKVKLNNKGLPFNENDQKRLDGARKKRTRKLTRNRELQGNFGN